MSTPLLPLSPAPASIVVKKRSRSKTSTADSGRIYSRATGGTFYEVSLVYNQMRPKDFAGIDAFLEEMDGKNGIFFIKMPDNYSGQVGEVIGNFANYDNDTKLHKITGLVPTVTAPPARVPAGNLVTSGVYMRCSLARDVHQVKIDRRGLISRFEIDLVERV